MASQFLCTTASWNSQCRRRPSKSVPNKYERVKNPASPRHMNYRHDQQSSSKSHEKFENTSQHSENGEHKKGKKKKFTRGTSEAAEHHGRSGLWYVTSCIGHILRKARAFCNEFCCDAIFYDGDDTTRKQGCNVEVMLVDPYLSFPVTPFTSHA